jgi:hypothetical protein
VSLHAFAIFLGTRAVHTKMSRSASLLLACGLIHGMTWPWTLNELYFLGPNLVVV